LECRFQVDGGTCCFEQRLCDDPVSVSVIYPEAPLQSSGQRVE